MLRSTFAVLLCGLAFAASPASAMVTIFIGTEGQAAFNALIANRITDGLEGATPGTGMYQGLGFQITNGTDRDHGNEVTIVDPGTADWTDNSAQRYSGKVAVSSGSAIGVAFETAVHAFSADLGAMLYGRTYGSDGKFVIAGARGVDHRIVDTYAAFSGPGPQCSTAFEATGQCGGLTFFGVISDEAFDFVEIVSDTYNDPGNGPLIDNVTYGDVASAAPVPEPGEWAMIAAGLLVTGTVGRRRRKG